MIHLIEVTLESMCDVCKEKKAGYYNTTYYIHVCSVECFNDFIAGYNREIEEIARVRLNPDETASIKRKERE